MLTSVIKQSEKDMIPWVQQPIVMLTCVVNQSEKDIFPCVQQPIVMLTYVVKNGKMERRLEGT